MTWMTLLVALLGAAAAGGLVLIVAGLRRSEARPHRTHPARWTSLSPRTRLLLLVGVAAGTVVALLTGWLVALVLIPAALVGIPWLMADPGGRDQVERLEAIEEWSRSLSSLLQVQQGLEQALATSARTAPPAIRHEVEQLALRLRLRWQTAAALRAFGDELHDATADRMVVCLIQVSHLRGAGLVAALSELAESVRDEVRARRQIESERTKVRGTVRIVTVIALVTITGELALGSWRAYASPLGQAVFAVLMAALVGLLVWLRHLSKPIALPRLFAPTPVTREADR